MEKERKMREKIHEKRKQKKERKNRGKKGGETRTIESDSSALPVKGETFGRSKSNFFQALAQDRLQEGF